jgi:hypothetical protein
LLYLTPKSGEGFELAGQFQVCLFLNSISIGAEKKGGNRDVGKYYQSQLTAFYATDKWRLTRTVGIAARHRTCPREHSDAGTSGQCEKPEKAGDRGVAGVGALLA